MSVMAKEGNETTVQAAQQEPEFRLHFADEAGGHDAPKADAADATESDEGSSGDAGDDDAPDLGDSKADAADPAGVTPEAPRASKTILRLAAQDREIAQLRSKLRDQERAHAQTKSQVPDFRSLDRLDAVRTVIASRLGIPNTDPRVQTEMSELMSELLFAGVDESAMSADDLKVFKQNKAERQKAKQDADWRRSMEEKYARSEQEKKEALMQGHEKDAMHQIMSTVQRDAAKYPFLMAQPEGDPGDMVATAILELVKTGQVSLNTPQDEEALIAQVSSNFDKHYRGLAMSLAPKLSKTVTVVPSKPDVDDDDQDDDEDDDEERPTRGSVQRRGRSARTATGTGGGGRGRTQTRTAPGPVDDDEDEGLTFSESISRGMQKAFAQKRGRAS